MATFHGEKSLYSFVRNRSQVVLATILNTIDASGKENTNPENSRHFHCTHKHAFYAS